MAHTPERACRQRRRVWRVEVLAEIEKAWLEGRIATASDIGTVSRSLGGEMSRNAVEVPLFFALINNNYGPMRIPDLDMPLRDRPIEELHDCGLDHSFLEHANAAWIAQAFTRVHNQFSGSTEGLQGVLIELAGEDEEMATLLLVVDFFREADREGETGPDDETDA